MDIENIPELVDYLRVSGRIEPCELPQCRLLTGGVSSRTVLVARPNGEKLVLKQALEKLRVEDDWFSPPDRILREAAGMDALRRITPAGSIPRLLFTDREKCLLAMEYVPEPHENWKAVLLSGRVEPSHYEQFANLLVSIHRGGTAREFQETFEDRYSGQRLGADGKDYRYAALKAALGNHPAESVTAQGIERALSRLAEERKWKPASFNRHKAFLSLAYRPGLESEKVQSNPVRLVHRRREDSGRIRWLSADEETKLRAVIQADYPDELPAFDLALHTGMRRSEQYGLAWDCVDFERRQITIPRSKHSGIRYIPLDNTAVAAFLALRSRGNGTGPVLVLAEAGHGYFAGHPLKTPREWFDASCRKAGIADFTWHCLRLTFASRLVMDGVSLRNVQELMGHKTIAMTCRYAHLSPQHLVEAVHHLDGWERKNLKPTDTKTDTGELQGVGAVPVVETQTLVQ